MFLSATNSITIQWKQFIDKFLSVSITVFAYGLRFSRRNPPFAVLFVAFISFKWSLSIFYPLKLICTLLFLWNNIWFMSGGKKAVQSFICVHYIGQSIHNEYTFHSKYKIDFYFFIHDYESFSCNDYYRQINFSSPNSSVWICCVRPYPGPPLY